MRQALQTSIINTADQLTPAWLTAALREGGALEEGVAVVDVDVTPLGTGQIGEVVRAALTYDTPASRGPQSVIVKLPSVDAASRATAAAADAYHREVRFYAEVLPELDISVPRAYWGDAVAGTDQFTLLLEDLSDSTQIVDMFGGCSPRQVATAVAELPKLQAPLWDARSRPELSWIDVPERTQVLFDGVPDALEPFLRRFADRLEPYQQDFLKQVAPLAGRFPSRAYTDPLTVVHGDFRLDNLLFTLDETTPAVTVLDWQWVHLGPPLVDVALLLGNGLSASDRRAQQDQLLRSYCDGLALRGVKGFPFEVCKQRYRRDALFPALLTMGFAVVVEETERGDAMVASLIRSYIDQAVDLGSAEFLL